MITVETRESEPAEVEVPELTPIHLQLKKILVPTDFSEESYKALRHAMDLARQYTSDLLLLHVVEPVQPYPVGSLTNYPPDLPPGPLFEAREDAGKLLRALQHEVKFRAATSVDAVLRIGRAYDQIVEVAGEFDADMIVISTHGYTGFKRVLLGSTTERVVRHAPCPVLVVRTRAHHDGRILQKE